MELLKKVTSLEVKRCFVFSNRFTSKKMRKDLLKKNIIKPEKETFSKNIKTVKKEILGMEESALDLIISTEYPKRLKIYNNIQWHVGYVDLSEVGLWYGAGGAPETWTKGTLQDSANIISRELKKNNSKYSRVRAMNVVPEIINFKAIVQKEKYLLPIILPGGINLSIRKRMNKTKGDIDDGCMRSLAFAASGDKKIKAYIGISI